MIKNVMNRSIIKDVVFFSTFALSLFIIFGLLNENSDKIQSIQYMIIKNLATTVGIFLACSIVFYISIKSRTDIKYSRLLITDIFLFLSSIIISGIIYFILYIIYYLTNRLFIDYQFNINLINIGINLLIITIFFFLLEGIKYIKYKIDSGYKINQVFYLLLSIIMLFMFIFINNSIIFILFYSVLGIFGTYLIYYGILLFNKFFVTHKSSFIIINNMIKKNMISYYITSIIVLFFSLMALFNEYNKYEYNRHFYRYDYEILDTSDELKTFLSDSPLSRYTVLEDKYDFVFKNKHYSCYAVDLSSVQSFFNINYVDRLSSIPDNAIILPLLSKNNLKVNIGDNLLININGIDYTYKVYGFYESGNDFIAYTNISINENNKKLLVEIENKDLMSYIENRFNIKAYDSKQIERIFINSSLVSFIISIVTFSMIVVFVLIMYKRIKKEYLNSIKDARLKLENAGVMKRRIKRFIFDSEFVQYLTSLISVSVFVILLSMIYNDEIMNIFRIYKRMLLLDYLFFIFMIFISYNIILMLEYLLGRGYYEEKKS